MKRISILGSTGSIGIQTLDVIERHPERFKVVALAARSSVDVLEQQIKKFRPDMAVLTDGDACLELEKRINGLDTKIVAGEEGLVAAATIESADMVVSSVVGACGLVPTIAAIKAGKDVALANKETLVAAGSLVMDLARQHNVAILPVDSEHSAIFQCLQASPSADISRIILTASGGPFRTTPADELKKVTVKQALDHPTWNMGGKITIDSATLMNKGLEVIEARWLFGVEPSKIEVVVHPESIIHSMVEFVDTSIIAQLGTPDMRVPIQYALTYPERNPSPAKSLDFVTAGQLNFHAPDLDRFPSLRLAYESLQAKGTAPCVLNASNEVAVYEFLDGKIGFVDIFRIVDEVLSRHRVIETPSLEDILESDRWAREEALGLSLS